MKEEIQWKNSFYTLGKAIDGLAELLSNPELDEIDYLRDASIQRFEFTIELFWKTLKKALFYEKIESTTPRDVLSKAYQYNLINDPHYHINNDANGLTPPIFDWPTQQDEILDIINNNNNTQQEENPEVPNISGLQILEDYVLVDPLGDTPDTPNQP